MLSVLGSGFSISWPFVFGVLCVLMLPFGVGLWLIFRGLFFDNGSDSKSEAGRKRRGYVIQGVLWILGWGMSGVMLMMVLSQS